MRFPLLPGHSELIACEEVFEYLHALFFFYFGNIWALLNVPRILKRFLFFFGKLVNHTCPRWMRANCFFRSSGPDSRPRLFPFPFTGFRVFHGPFSPLEFLFTGPLSGLVTGRVTHYSEPKPSAGTAAVGTPTTGGRSDGKGRRAETGSIARKKSRPLAPQTPHLGETGNYSAGRVCLLVLIGSGARTHRQRTVIFDGVGLCRTVAGTQRTSSPGRARSPARAPSARFISEAGPPRNAFPAAAAAKQDVHSKETCCIEMSFSSKEEVLALINTAIKQGAVMKRKFTAPRGVFLLIFYPALNFLLGLFPSIYILPS